MEPQDAIDLCREALMLLLTVSAPVLIVGLIVGLAIGLLQALTQVQEQTVALVPKIVAMLVVLGLTLPWVLSRMVEYSRELIRNIPDNL